MKSNQFSLVLSQTLKGKTVLEKPSCRFSVNWDFEKNMGLATLHSINGSEVNITLHPLGISGSLDFMSDIKPTSFSVNANNDNSVALVEVIIYRVILDLDEKGENPSVAIMFGKNGENIQTSQNFSENSVAKELPSVK
ncbi:hypothetical protein FDT66_13755 [Polaribacter aestuariivivens]|uniref:Uncharacterized protein n=1 Tax=Polaribacter aestuariivivens TaxID=2304626 RepID=A0A5S3N0I4_9FLAO|nr:hypothetical protein [Polaribacter aestuariivivens]TMM28663.1 hypothetical protein FDT66_13755 [Polaribacter aestuariivivens]